MRHHGHVSCVYSDTREVRARAAQVVRVVGGPGYNVGTIHKGDDPRAYPRAFGRVISPPDALQLLNSAGREKRVKKCS